MANPALCAALCAALASMARADAPVAVFAEPGFPYYNTSLAIGPGFVQYCLGAAGIEAELLNADQLADSEAFSAGRYAVLAYIYGNTFPYAALANLRQFHADGGCIVAFGGVPFCHPCVRNDGKWVDLIGELGWEFVSHEQMGTGLWGDATDVGAVVHAPGDPLGVAWLPLPAAPAGVVQFLRLGVTLEDSRAAGYEHLLGLPPEDIVTPVVSVVKGGAIVGSPVCIIEHHCPEFPGAVDIWAGGTLSASLTAQQQEQLVVACCSYLLERKGVIAGDRRREVLARTRERYVVPLVEAPPREGPFVFRASEPARRLVVLDVMGLTADEQLLALSLQGLINRRQPRVYLLGLFQDTKWLREIEKAGHESEACDSLKGLLDRFRDEVPGAVVYDPGSPHTINLATMLAGVRGAVMASPDSAERYGLRVLEDLRGRFADPMDGYEWALETLWPQLEHRGIACMEPTWLAPRDYLVQFPMFTFWLDGQCSQPLPPREALFFERLLAGMPPHGAVYGWWQQGDDGGIGEGRGVDVSSKHGKITVCTLGAFNLSVHSGLPMPEPVHQPRIEFGSLDRKVYVTFIVSDGDNFSMDLYNVIGGLWEQGLRGRVPIGWGMCPTQVELTPIAVRYWQETATPNDLFVTMDGLGYVYPDQYGSALGDAASFYREFLRQTQPYMERLDHRHLWFLGGTSRAPLMAEVLRPDGLFGEYGVPAQQRQELYGETAAIWADVNPWEKPWDAVDVYVQRIRDRTPAARPAFLFVGTNGFSVGPNQVGEMLRQLGPEYVAVRPDELCYLFRKYKTVGLDANPVPRPALDLMPPAPPGPRTTADGTLLVREDDNSPDIGGWYTDPQGTQWVRKRLVVPLPANAKRATIFAYVRGEKGKRVTFRVNGHEHAVPLASSGWEWVRLAVPANELRTGENEIWYTGNPEGRLMTAGDGTTDLDHSDFGGPDNWSSLAGELMCYVEVR